MHTLGEKLNKGLLALFAVLYAGIWVLVTFFNTSFEYRPAFQLLLIAVWGVLLAAVLWGWKYVGAWCCRHKYSVALGVLLLVFLVQLFLSLQTVPNPMYDHGKVFWGASHYAKYGNEGEAFAVYDGYLHHYPNNVGLFLLQQMLFRLTHLVGIDADYMVAATAGHLLFFVMLWAGFLYLDEALDTNIAFFYLLAAGIYVPVYFQSMVSYTDTWSAWCIPCTLLFGLRAVRAEKWPKRLLYGLLMGAVLGLGMQIKVTVLIVLVALLIQWVLNGEWKKAVPVLAAAALALLVVTVGFRAWKHADVIDPTRDEGMPTTHWLMMGLQDDGSYNWIDEWYITCSVRGKEARTQLNKEVIRERLQEMGVGGYIRLLGRKTCRSFGSGNADLRYSLLYEDEAQPINLLYHFVFENGRYYSVFNNLSNSVYLLLLLLAILAAVCALRKKELQQCSALWIALIGFWVFMMLWESNHRQWINQWSLLFMTAAVGIGQLRAIWAGIRMKTGRRTAVPCKEKREEP